MEVFDINGQIISPLAGKTLYVAGDSIAYGKSSAGGLGKRLAGSSSTSGISVGSSSGGNAATSTSNSLPTNNAVSKSIS